MVNRNVTCSMGSNVLAGSQFIGGFTRLGSPIVLLASKVTWNSGVTVGWPVVKHHPCGRLWTYSNELGRSGIWLWLASKPNGGSISQSSSGQIKRRGDLLAMLDCSGNWGKAGPTETCMG